jgi:hypothetical protein
LGKTPLPGKRHYSLPSLMTVSISKMEQNNIRKKENPLNEGQEH